MRVFVTGASGHIGTAVVTELLEAGHQVVGLARSQASATTIARLGAEVHHGDLAEPDAVADAAARADGVIHLAYDHSFTDFAAAAATDLRLVQALGERLTDTGKALVTTSGTLLIARLGLARPGTEDDVMPGGPRVDTENATVALAARGVRSSAVRLSPLVHSPLDHHGFTHQLIAAARAKGVSGHAGDGGNRWTGLHTLDAARLYRLAVEKAPAGSRFHGAEDEGVPFRRIAEVIGHKLGLPVTPIPEEDLQEHFGFLAAFVGMDAPVSSTRTRELLGWKPTHPGLLEDIEEGHYFQ